MCKGVRGGGSWEETVDVLNRRGCGPGGRMTLHINSHTKKINHYDTKI